MYFQSDNYRSVSNQITTSSSDEKDSIGTKSKSSMVDESTFNIFINNSNDCQNQNNQSYATKSR